MQTAIRYRPYQIECLDIIKRELPKAGSGVVVLPTGTGKTRVFAGLPEWLGITKRILVLCHRKELIEQAMQKLREQNPLLVVEAEQAERYASDFCHIVVASVPTLGLEGSQRLARFLPEEFGLVIADEVHHGVAPTWHRIFEHFANVPRIGFTATPERTDGIGLKAVFRQVFFQRSFRDMMLPDPADPHSPYLSRIRAWKVMTKTRFDGIATRTTTDGEKDFNLTALSEAVNNEPRNQMAVEAYLEKLAGKRALVFCVDVKHATAMTNQFRRNKIRAAMVVGDTPDEERQRYYRDFHEGTLQVLVNVYVLCLDEKTEILTDRGWAGIDEMTYEHQVANWKDGSIFFTPPTEIVRRPRREDERMVIADGSHHSIRVNDTHKMLSRKRAHQSFVKTSAAEIVDQSVQLPVSGLAEPWSVTPTQAPVASLKRIRRLVSSGAYNLRSLEGYDSSESYVEAGRRVGIREGLRYKNPADLSIAECEFIGFWIGDGSATPVSGGIEYSLSQSTVYPAIIAWVDDVLNRLGVHFLRKEKPANGNANPHIRWSLCRGTGGGSQERAGIYHLEPYLDKDGADLFWGLAAEQLDAVLRGFWYADGNHGSGEQYPKKRHSAFNCSYKLLSLLQSIAVCRGYWTALRPSFRPRKPNHRQLYRLAWVKSEYRHLSRPSQQLHFEEAPWKPERLWCVNVPAHNIITRRDGFVTVTGNTEGWDEPRVEGVIMARPTQSPLLYTQCIGRGTRICDICQRQGCQHKPYLALIDLVDNTNIEIPSAATLMGLPPRWDFRGDDLVEACQNADRMKQVQQMEVQQTAMAQIHQSIRELKLLGTRDQKVELRRISTLSWMMLYDQTHVLKIDFGDILRAKEDFLGSWHLTNQHRDRGETKIGIFQTRRDALVTGDEWVLEHRGKSRYRNLQYDAYWRTRPASAKQAVLLGRLKLWRGGMTCGEAQDLIDVAICSAQHRRQKAGPKKAAVGGIRIKAERLVLGQRKAVPPVVQTELFDRGGQPMQRWRL